MTKDELEIQKLEAEVEKLHAEALESRQRRKWSGLSDTVKIIGGVLVGVIGLWAAATTYQINQLQTRLAMIDKAQAEKERSAALQARNVAVAARMRAEAETKAAERDLAGAQVRIESARAEIAKLEKARQSVEVTASLRRVSGSLDDAARTTSRSIPYVLVVPAIEAQDAQAVKLATSLSENGFGAGVFRHLRDSRLAPVVTEVRYFRPEDLEEGKHLTSVIGNSSVRISSIQLTYVAEPTGRRPRSFEVRFAVDLARAAPPA
jgi:cytoskeletal protein RodZ